jgi:hypothetical protein
MSFGRVGATERRLLALSKMIDDRDDARFEARDGLTVEARGDGRELGGSDGRARSTAGGVGISPASFANADASPSSSSASSPGTSVGDSGSVKRGTGVRGLRGLGGAARHEVRWDDDVRCIEIRDRRRPPVLEAPARTVVRVGEGRAGEEGTLSMSDHQLERLSSVGRAGTGSSVGAGAWAEVVA